MDPISVSYACLILGGAALFWALRRTPFGGLVLLGCAIVFFSSKPLALGVFLAATAITIVGLRTKKTAPAVAALAALLLAFKALDAPWWPKDGIAGLAGFALPLGISYYILRAIAALIESSRGVLREPKILEAAGFLGFAPILLLGPIERASAFIGQMRGSLGLREIPAYLWGGIGRIAEGLFKVLVLCEVLKRHAEPFASGKTAELAGVDPAGLWTGLCGYSLYLYVNFSGASDLAIGAGRLFGFKIAENFDLPTRAPTSPSSGARGTSRSRPGCATSSSFRSGSASRAAPRRSWRHCW